MSRQRTSSTCRIDQTSSGVIGTWPTSPRVCESPRMAKTYRKPPPPPPPDPNRLTIGPSLGIQKIDGDWFDDQYGSSSGFSDAKIGEALHSRPAGEALPMSVLVRAGW